MDPREYYHRVIDRLENCFQHNHYAIATGTELVAAGADPAFPALTAPVVELERLSVRDGLRVHLPVVGERSHSVLMPLDFEIFLGDQNHTLYENEETHRSLFTQVISVARFLEELFRSYGMPYLLDYTPSGGHILFHNLLDYRATEAVASLGCLEDDVVAACQYVDANDIRRWYGVSLDAARVFNGLGKLAEYIGLLTMQAFRDNEAKGLLPVTIADSELRCFNMDNSWCEGSPFMRSIRSPFSLHKKNQENYGKWHQPPLVDVIGACYDGKNAIEEPDAGRILDCMWDLDKAASHAQAFTGFIPCSNESLIDFISSYEGSDLYEFHRDFDAQDDMARGQALERARREHNVSDSSKHLLAWPNPAALQPMRLSAFVEDFLMHVEWKPKHIANILRDVYQDPGYGWTQDFFRYPAEAKASFWARTYSAVALWQAGRLTI